MGIDRSLLIYLTQPDIRLSYISERKKFMMIFVSVLCEGQDEVKGYSLDFVMDLRQV